MRVGRLDGSASETIEAVVDTGATYTWVPRPVLERLGIRSADTRQIQMADGRVIEREIGSILVTVDGKTVPTLCIFGDPESTPLLGAVTLEECSLAPDPVAQRLIPVIGYALAARRTAAIAPAFPARYPASVHQC